jgi:uncharacterized RDD family membrane protein YckC
MGSLAYQGFGSRLVAQIVDGIILLIVNYILGATMAGATSFAFYGAEAYPLLGAGGVIFLLYFVILEGMWGATVGKMVMKIKVVREDGSACGLMPALIRNILRIIDALPFLYIIGLIFMSRSDKKQRLGDRIAKTVVVKSGAAPVGTVPVPAVAPSAGGKRFCTNCGAELHGGSGFCGKCGAKQ